MGLLTHGVVVAQGTSNTNWKLCSNEGSAGSARLMVMRMNLGQGQGTVGERESPGLMSLPSGDSGRAERAVPGQGVSCRG
jgi:hypothetical protein